MSHKKPIPPGLKPWKPGQSGNPGGQPKRPDWLVGVTTLPADAARLAWSKWLKMDAAKLKEQANNWQLSALELGMCRAILRDIETGDLRNIEIGLSRIIGKLGEAGPSQDGDADLRALPTEELLNRVRNAIQTLELARNDSGEYQIKERGDKVD